MEIQQNELTTYLQNIISEGAIRIVLSNPTSATNKYRKVEIENKQTHFMENKYTQKQSFTKNVATEDVVVEILSQSNDFKQYNLFTTQFVYEIKVSKKGKLFFSKSKNQSTYKATTNNDREKQYILQEGIIQPLIDMGIYSKDGKIIKAMYDKYKQINRFIELIDDYIKNNNYKQINIVDFGCGKSYLTFVVYHYFKYIKGVDINMVGLDLKADVIEKCNQTAQKYGYDNLHFELGDINGYKPNMDIDMIITLHACDTATDYALYNAINWKVKMIFSVPCCQHEVGKQISSSDLPITTRYGIIRERLASDFTDIVRCNLLKAMSYNVELIEFIGFEHTPKNLLIRANLTKMPKDVRKSYLQEVEQLENAFNFNQTLHTLLKDKLPQ